MFVFCEVCECESGSTIYMIWVLDSKVQEALRTLVNNPILRENPDVMADFIKALTQKQVHRIPTPMMTDVPPPVPTPAQPPAQEDESINARKAFWAKFKRAKSARNVEESDGQVPVDDTASILSKPTLVLGETEEPAEVVNSSIVPPPAESVKEPDFVELALVAVEELSKPSKKEMMKVRFSKMDDVELQRALTKIRGHSFYPKFSISKEGAAVVGKGIVDELACFFYMLEHRNDPCPNMPPDVPTLPASEKPQPEPETPKPSKPSPVSEMPAPNDPKKPEHDEQPPAPPGASGESMVATALKRISTVDLENGCRPPQSLLGKSDPPPQTVVLMNVHGIEQPVALPLSPEQCVAAGLVLAHPPHQESEQKTLPPVPAFTDTKAEPTPTGHAHDDGRAHDDGHDGSMGALQEDKQLTIGVNSMYCFDMYNRIQYM